MAQLDDARATSGHVHEKRVIGRCLQWTARHRIEPRSTSIQRANLHAARRCLMVDDRNDETLRCRSNRHVAGVGEAFDIRQHGPSGAGQGVLQDVPHQRAAPASEIGYGGQDGNRQSRAIVVGQHRRRSAIKGGEHARRRRRPCRPPRSWQLAGDSGFRAAAELARNS